MWVELLMITQHPSVNLPLSDPRWRQWLDQVQHTGAVLAGIDPTNPNYGQAAPNDPAKGQLAYADGAAWNPGSGEGLYRYTGSAWHFIG
jgi:hypothetical protein